MPDRIFIDTNILIYFVGSDIEKRTISESIIYSDSIKVLSTQVINEFLNVSYKKNISAENELTSLINDFISNFEVNLIYNHTIHAAVNLKNKYKYSYFDTLMLASAIENDCEILYTEDLQHNQVIEDKLTIINPFA
jgi:predicted nucleic acid-binding protein